MTVPELPDCVFPDEVLPPPGPELFPLELLPPGPVLPPELVPAPGPVAFPLELPVPPGPVAEPLELVPALGPGVFPGVVPELTAELGFVVWLEAAVVDAVGLVSVR